MRFKFFSKVIKNYKLKNEKLKKQEALSNFLDWIDNDGMNHYRFKDFCENPKESPIGELVDRYTEEKTKTNLFKIYNFISYTKLIISLFILCLRKH